MMVTFLGFFLSITLVHMHLKLKIVDKILFFKAKNKKYQKVQAVSSYWSDKFLGIKITVTLTLMY